MPINEDLPIDKVHHSVMRYTSRVRTALAGIAEEYNTGVEDERKIKTLRKRKLRLLMLIYQCIILPFEKWLKDEKLHMGRNCFKYPIGQHKGNLKRDNEVGLKGRIIGLAHTIKKYGSRQLRISNGKDSTSLLLRYLWECSVKYLDLEESEVENSVGGAIGIGLDAWEDFEMFRNEYLKVAKNFDKNRRNADDDRNEVSGTENEISDVEQRINYVEKGPPESCNCGEGACTEVCLETEQHLMTDSTQVVSGEETSNDESKGKIACVPNRWRKLSPHFDFLNKVDKLYVKFNMSNSNLKKILILHLQKSANSAKELAKYLRSKYFRAFADSEFQEIYSYNPIEYLREAFFWADCLLIFDPTNWLKHVRNLRIAEYSNESLLFPIYQYRLIEKFYVYCSCINWKVACLIQNEKTETIPWYCPEVQCLIYLQNGYNDMIEQLQNFMNTGEVVRGLLENRPLTERCR